VACDEIQGLLNRIYDSTNNALKIGTGSASGVAAYGSVHGVGSKTGVYYYLPCNSTGTANTLGNGTARVFPVFFSSAVTLTRIGAEVTGAGEANSVVRLGIYNDNGTGFPGTVLLDAGTIDGTSATIQEITISQAVPAGLFWMCAVVQAAPTTQPTLRVVSSVYHNVVVPQTVNTQTSAANIGLSQASVTGALGTWSGTSSSGAMARMFWKT